MTFNYEPLRQKAQALINEFGQSMTITTQTPAAGDDPWDPATLTTVTRTVKGVVQEMSRNLIDGSAVRLGDLSVLIEAASGGTVPTTAEKVTIGGLQYSIVHVASVAPGGTTLYYQLQVRR